MKLNSFIDNIIQILPYFSGALFGIVTFHLVQLVFKKGLEEYFLRKTWQEKVIIPEYNVPNDLCPLEGDIMIHGHAGSAAWPATIVDLRYRKKIDFTADNNTVFADIKPVPFFVIIAMCFVASELSLVLTVTPVLLGLCMCIALYVLVFTVLGYIQGHRSLKKIWMKNQYVFFLTCDIQHDTDLRPFEKRFLRAVFSHEKEISTRIFRGGRLRDLNMDLAMIIADVTQEYPPHSIIPEKEKIALDQISASFERITQSRFVNLFMRAIIIVIVLLVMALMSVARIITEWLHMSDAFFVSLITIIVALCVAVIGSFISWQKNFFAAPDAHWRGFELYLRTAEKNRLQDLSPDQFEHFLPYAMILGLEGGWQRDLSMINEESFFYQRPDGEIITRGGSELLLFLLIIIGTFLFVMDLAHFGAFGLI